jgi:predicted alpha/beta-hydrolase family hydrolase
VRNSEQRQVQGTMCPVELPVRITGMARARMLLALSLLATSSLTLAADRTIKVTWGTAQHVTAVISYPAGKEKVPTLIIASGRSGGMDTPIIKGLANKAVRDGMVAVRFNYTYFAQKGTPSEGLVDEVDQLNAVIQEALKDPRVDSKRLIIAGKSLGSVVAHRVFQNNSSFLGEVLLTPVILTQDDANRLYPNLPLAGRPTVLVIGNQDVDNAPLGVVYNYLKDASRKIMLNVVAGDHGFEVGSGSDVAKRANAANIDAALDVSQYWVRQIARILPPAPPAVSISKGTAKPKPKSGAASGG